MRTSLLALHSFIWLEGDAMVAAKFVYRVPSLHSKSRKVPSEHNLSTPSDVGAGF